MPNRLRREFPPAVVPGGAIKTPVDEGTDDAPGQDPGQSPPKQAPGQQGKPEPCGERPGQALQGRDVPAHEGSERDAGTTGDEPQQENAGAKSLEVPSRGRLELIQGTG
jgi:hypothetical protein